MDVGSGFPVHDKVDLAQFQQTILDTADTALKDPRAPVVEADPSLLSLLSSHWQAGTSIGALTANAAWRTGTSEDARPMTPTDVQIAIDENGIEPEYRSAFYGVRDTEAFNAVLADVSAGRERANIMRQFGLGANLAAGIATGIADPVNLIPLGGAVSKVRMAQQGALVTAGRTAVQAGVGAAATEGVIQLADPTKTAGQSAVDIAAGTLFGGLLGWGVHAVVAAPKARQIEARMQQYVQSPRMAVDEIAKNIPAARSHVPADPAAAAALRVSVEDGARAVADNVIARTDARLQKLADDANARFNALFPHMMDMETPGAVNPGEVRNITRENVRPLNMADDAAVPAIRARATNDDIGPIEPSAIRDFRYGDRVLAFSREIANGNDVSARSLANDILSDPLLARMTDEQRARISDDLKAVEADARNSNEQWRDVDTTIDPAALRSPPDGRGVDPASVKPDNDTKGGGKPAPLSAGIPTYIDNDRADDRLFGVYSPSGVQAAIGKAVAFLRNPRLELQAALSDTLRSTLDKLDMVPQITKQDVAGQVRGQTNVHGEYRDLSGKWAAAQEDAEYLWHQNKRAFTSQDDFGKQVYTAVINGGRSDNPIIEQAAAGYRTYFDAVLKKYQDANIFDTETTLANAESYAPIVHMIDNIRNDSARFIEAHTRAFSDDIMADWTKAVDTKKLADARVAALSSGSKAKMQQAVADIETEYGKGLNPRSGKIREEADNLKSEMEARIEDLKDKAREALAKEADLKARGEVDGASVIKNTTLIRERRDQDIAKLKADYDAKIKERRIELARERDAKVKVEADKHAAFVDKARGVQPAWDKTLLNKLGQDRDTAQSRADVWSDELARSYYDGATKNAVINGHDIPGQPALANVLKARKGKLLQETAAANGWIETNIFRLAESYHRRAGMDAAIATVFKKQVVVGKKTITIEPIDTKGMPPSLAALYKDRVPVERTVDDVREVGDIELTSVKNNVAEEYKTLIDRARDAGDAEAETKLVAERNRQLGNLDMLLDMTRGRMSDPNAVSANVKTAGDMAMMFNAWRLMGGTVVASLGDPVNLVIANGLGKTLRHGIAPAFANFKAAMGLVPRDELPDVYRINRLMGIVIEHQSNSRIGAMADLGAEAPSNRTQAWMQRLNRNFWNITGITYWTTFWKNAAAAVTHGRIIMAAQEGFAKQSPGTQAWLTNLKLTEADLAAIKAAHDAQPQKYSAGVPYAALDQWQNRDLANLVANALHRESHNVIITPTAGDKLALQATPVGQLVWQFRSYGLAQSARLMSRNAALGNIDGGNRAALYGGIVSLAMMGALVDGLKTSLGDTTITGDSKSGKDGPMGKWLERWQKTPGEQMYNALDRSGAFWLLTEPSNIAQKLGLPNFQGAMALAVGDEEKAKSGASRFAQRSVADVALGPTVSLIEDFAKLGHLATGAAGYATGISPEWKFSRGDASRVQRLIPLQNALGIQQIMNAGHAYGATVFDWPDPQ